MLTHLQSNAHLLVLDLSDNRITETEALAASFYASLYMNNTLTALLLGRNLVGTLCGEAILKVLQEKPTQILKTLTITSRMDAQVYADLSAKCPSKKGKSKKGGKKGKKGKGKGKKKK